MRYPKRRFSKQNVAECALEFGTAAVDSVFTAPIFKMDTPLAGEVKQLSKGFKEHIAKENVKTFFEKLSGKLWKKVISVVRGKTWTDDYKCQMLQQFHRFRTDTK